ncbi:MAG: chemotaxis protein CheW [Actinomycetota bacterium]
MTDPTNRLQLCTFHLDELYLGIDVTTVQEVLSGIDITEVPHADPAISGLINLRGQLASTLDLRVRFGLPERTPDTKSLHVVVRPAGEWISLLVDSAGDVVDVDPAAYEKPPETLDERYRELILGAYKLSDALLLIMDVSAAVTLEPEELPPVDRPAPVG